MDAAFNAACLVVALLWRVIVGRVLRRTVERVVGAPPRFEHPLLDLLVGLEGAVPKPLGWSPSGPGDRVSSRMAPRVTAVFP